MINDLRTSDDDPERLEPLGRQLVFTAKAVREAFEQALRKAGGSLGTWVVLNAVTEGGVVSQSALASHVHVEGATITHHVDRLEKLGLVQRRIDDADRRVRRIEATPEGKRLYRRLVTATSAFEATMLDGLTDDDQKELRRLLGRIGTNLGEAAGPRPGRGPRRD